MKMPRKSFNVFLSALLALLILLLPACELSLRPEPSATPPVGTGGFPWWNDTIFYEIFVRSFFDSDGDGIGDFKGLTQKLDYLNDGNPDTDTDLGITGIWLMPIHPSPSYHGYDVTDYRNINPQYGTLEDFQAFLNAAHRRGIRVIIDLVLNHTSSEHPWFQAAQDPASPYRDWYVWSATNPGGAGWNKSAAGDYYYSSFVPSMPDLNYTNPAVGQEMLAIVKYWSEMGVDGFRLDAAKHLIEEGANKVHTAGTHAWLAELRRFYQQIDPDGLLLGEVWDDSAIVQQYLQGDELHLAFDFDLAKAMVASAGVGFKEQIARQLSLDINLFASGQFATFLTNHDQDRVMSVIGNNPDKAKVAAALLLTSPGVPFIYYGEEIGMTGTKPDPRLRTPMQWSAEKNAGFTTFKVAWRTINPDFKTVNVAAQTRDPQSLLSHYRRLIRLRQSTPALRIGETLPVSTGNTTVFAFLRFSADPAQTVLVLINLSGQAVTQYSLELKEGPLQGAWKARLLFGPAGQDEPAAPETNAAGGFAGYLPFNELPPFSTFVIELSTTE